MEFKDDALRGRFTAWMKVVVKRAKIDYIRREKKHLFEISMDEECLNEWLSYEPLKDKDFTEGFSFDNMSLSAAFNKLSPKRRHVLELLFVHNLTPEEIAIELQCSVQHVYNMRSLALIELRKAYIKEGK